MVRVYLCLQALNLTPLSLAIAIRLVYKT
jgi:hypothetical protein